MSTLSKEMRENFRPKSADFLANLMRSGRFLRQLLQIGGNGAVAKAQGIGRDQPKNHTAIFRLQGADGRIAVEMSVVAKGHVILL